MPFLTEIKERISATTDTRKITQSLELVAASKMKGFVKKAVSSRDYVQDLVTTLTLLSGNASAMPFSEQRENGPAVFVLLTSDKGLCGSLNQRLIKFLFTHKEWNKLSPEQRLLVCIGRKGEESARRLGIRPELSFPGISENITPVSALKIVDKIVSLWNEKEVSSISLVSPHYVNPFTSVVGLRTYLPFSLEMVKSHMAWSNKELKVSDFVTSPIFEPDKSRVMNLLALQIVEILFTHSFYELKASEYSSRMTAMKKASDSAGEMIETLTLEYNKARQNQITQQLSELAVAAEATMELNLAKKKVVLQSV